MLLPQVLVAEYLALYGFQCLSACNEPGIYKCRVEDLPNFFAVALAKLYNFLSPRVVTKDEETFKQ